MEETNTGTASDERVKEQSSWFQRDEYPASR